jgi:phosphinothricin acetyltransferase
MIIRAATVQDAPALADIWNPYIIDTANTFTTIEKSPTDLAHEITVRQAGGDAFLVATEADEVLGFATYFQFRKGPGYVNTKEHSIWLAPNACGHGIGRALMAALESHAVAADVHSLIAAISSENAAAVAFYEKIGFCRVAVIPQAGLKFDRWIDLVLLQKLLGNAA